MKNRDTLYDIVHRKLPASIRDILPERNRPRIITCLNVRSMYQIRNRPELYGDFDYICMDGKIGIRLQRLMGYRLTSRISFDETSMAPLVYRSVIETGGTIYFIGSHETTIGAFVEKIKASYPEMNICGYSHGYIKDTMEDAISEILRINPDVVVAGLGIPLQDVFAVEMKKRGYPGTVYTCGGYIHQTAMAKTLQYYPRWIDRYDLRFLYRLYKEKEARRRLVYAPAYLTLYLYQLARMRCAGIFGKRA